MFRSLKQISTKNTPESIAEGLRRGGNDYITKPVDKDVLLARIHNQLMICHTCRMVSSSPHRVVTMLMQYIQVCKNSQISGKDDIFVCDTCKHTTPKPVRHAVTDMVTDLVNEPPNSM